MVVPITNFGILAKRLAQLSRRTGAITIPDLFRERFASPVAGLVSSLLIIFLMSIMIVPQFKAGASIMKIVWPNFGGMELSTTNGQPLDMPYLIGLGVFALVVVGYTSRSVDRFVSKRRDVAGRHAAARSDLVEDWRFRIGDTNRSPTHEHGLCIRAGILRGRTSIPDSGVGIVVFLCLDLRWDGGTGNSRSPDGLS
jgi:hypothetical protein